MKLMLWKNITKLFSLLLWKQKTSSCLKAPERRICNLSGYTFFLTQNFSGFFSYSIFLSEWKGIRNGSRTAAISLKRGYFLVKCCFHIKKKLVLWSFLLRFYVLSITISHLTLHGILLHVRVGASNCYIDMLNEAIWWCSIWLTGMVFLTYSCWCFTR